MSLKALTKSFPWSRYSKKLMAKIDNPRNAGFFSEEESKARGMRLAHAAEGACEDGNRIALYWLVDPEDGKIVDAKFQVFGQSALIGAAEVVCDVLIGKNYDQAKRVSADLIDKQVRDRSDDPAFPEEAGPHLNFVLEVIDLCAEQCSDIPLPTSYAAPPAPQEIGEVLEGGIPDWETFTDKKKIAVIEQVLDQDIRPYIALDGGGVEIKEIHKGSQVIITYQGACTSCFSSVGTTLSYIQQVLRAKVHPSLDVVPDFNH